MSLTQVLNMLSSKKKTDINVLLLGKIGSGKTSVIKKITKDHSLETKLADTSLTQNLFKKKV